MKEIPGYAYLAVGVLVSLMSFFINYQKLIFFFYVGLVMALVGLVKLFFSFLKKEKEPAHKEHHSKRRPRCPSCGAVRYPSFNYCPICGHNLRQNLNTQNQTRQ